MAKQKIETSIEINGIDVVAYPLVESDHVTFENGMSINEMIKGDVSTPVVTHEEISFKVGKGDSDVSSSIVDSSVGEMIIKGQTYQNILPEPSLRNSMSKGKTMQKFNEGYDNVNVVDGVGKSAILKGQTLVNVANQIHVINYVEQPKADYITLVHTGNENAKSIRLKNNGLLKPNTKYLIMLDVVENTLTTKMQISKNAALCGFNDIEMYPIKAGQTGVVKLIVTSKNEFINVRDYLYLTTLFGQIGDGTQQIKLRIMLLEYQDGMENWDIPYFEGMTSVKAPTVKTVGKNLFDKLVYSDLYFDSSGLTLVTGNQFARSIIFKVNKNESYVVSGFDKLLMINNSNAIRVLFTRDTPRIGNSVVRLSNLTGTIVVPENGYILLGNLKASGRWTDEEWINAVGTIQIEQGIQATPYEPHKSNTLTTPSDLILRRIGDVYDTLDLVSGEKVERIGEIVLDGGYFVEAYTHNDETHTSFIVANVFSENKVNRTWYSTSSFNFNTYGSASLYVSKVPHSLIGSNKGMSATERANCFKKFIINNPIEIFYTLDEPTITQIPLTSSGNWEKVILDGSEDERWTKVNSGVNRGKTSLFIMSPLLSKAIGGSNHFNNKSMKYENVWINDIEGVQIENGFDFRHSIKKTKLVTDDLDGFKQYLRANPITVWYQTTTNKENTQVKQPLSFSNGHVQLSSEEGSLIPSLDYEVSTSNSYHLDLAKTSTQYTMKNMSGTFTIDNNNYNASANSAFTTPTSMANKLMITSVVQSNVMLLEGDLTSKTIPYFKGIKSAFEGEDEIEVLSVGKNLFDNSRVNNYLAEYLDNGYVKITGGKEGDIFAEQRAKPLIKPNTKYTITVDIIENTMAGVFEVQYSGDKRASLKSSFYIDTGFVGKISKTCNSKEVIENELVLVPKVIKQNTSGHVIFRIIVEETSTPTSYEPYKSNITKIPLSSPLRSLPNGVRDEVVLDRENNKVKVVQRVGEIKLNGSDDENWAVDMLLDKNTCSNMMFKCFNIKNIINYDLIATGMLCDKFTQVKGGDLWAKDVTGVASSNGEGIKIGISKSLLVTHDTLGFRQWLSKNLVEVQYQLATPIITEIDLDGYPYIYKDGHIFLNSKIAPTTTMKYSINQSHQIASQNGDLIRHEKEINYLYTLIAKYVNVQYESTLLNLDLELSRA